VQGRERGGGVKILDVQSYKSGDVYCITPGLCTIQRLMLYYPLKYTSVKFHIHFSYYIPHTEACCIVVYYCKNKFP
jgi:hypothetical protein